MLNKCIFIGRCGKDPEVRYTADGTPVAQFNLATTETWKDRNGTKQEKTLWLKIVAWRKLGEIVGQYVKKGSLLYIEGKLEIREYEDREGIKRRGHEIVIHDMKMLGGGKSQDSASGFSNSTGRNNNNNSASGGQYGGGRSDDDEFPHESEYDDDVPL